VSDRKPRRVLSKSATLVLVPGRPVSVLICRYWGGFEPRPGTLAEALQGSSQYAVSRMASELNDLPQSERPGRCPDALLPMGGYRSVLFMFRYRGAGDAAVLREGDLRETVTNGRVARDGLELPHIPFPNQHWPEEGMI
jgi:hypothetical protein